MPLLATLAVMVVAALMRPTAISGYSFGDWAGDQGYDSGDAMPDEVDVGVTSHAIDGLHGIGEFGWGTTPTTRLKLESNQLSSIESGAFSGLTNLQSLYLEDNMGLTELNLAGAVFLSLERFNLDASTNIGSVSLRSAIVSQNSLVRLLDGEPYFSRNGLSCNWNRRP